MKAFILLAGIGVSFAHAGQGLVLSPGHAMTFPIRNTAPFSSLQSTRIELRVHAWAIPPGIANLVSVPGIQVRLAGSSYNGPLLVTDWLDTFAPGAGDSVALPVGGISDLVIRVQRDLGAGMLTVQAWSADGTGKVLAANLPIAAAGVLALPDQGHIGDALSTGVLDYLRWFSTVVPPASSPFNPDPGDLADFEFDNDLTDVSPQNLTLALSAKAPLTYQDSPAYNPLASQGPQRVLHAGTAESLDGSSSRALNDSTALTYQWSQLSGPTQLQFDSQTSVKPLIAGLAFGSYRIQLTVTDSAGQSSTSILKYGSVFTNANDVVIPPQPYVTTILGPMLRFGASPWPYFDRSQKSMADFFGALQASDYLDVWNQAQPGTIDLINGSAAVTGTGTSFLSTFCGGGSVGLNGATLVIDYPVNGSPGQWGRAPYPVASCQSDTALTLAQPYAHSTDAANISFAAMNNNSVGIWINGSSNANYYDNVMAFYSLYYRSGLDDYLNDARTLADRWYTMPWFDQGRASLKGSTSLFPRVQSLTGLMLRAMDGRPEYWEGIRLYLKSDFAFANTAPVAGLVLNDIRERLVLNDIREQGYATAFLALAALFDPTPAGQQLYASQLQTLVSNIWVPALQPAGNWVNTSFGYASWNGFGGSVNVSKGSTTVTGTGTNWQAGWFANNSFWTADPNGVTNGDSVAYTAAVLSPTQLSLSVPYRGNSATGRGWQANSLVGSGTQPYMLGIAGQAIHYAYLATGDPRLPGILTGLQSWISKEGYRSDARGLWYGRMFPNCEPISASNAACSGGSPEQSRFLSGETVGLLSAVALLPGNASTIAFGDNLFGAMFGGPPCGPDADDVFVTDIANGDWAMQNKLAKDFGFFFGFGGGPAWLAARLGADAIAPTSGCAFTLGQESASFTSAGGSGTISLSPSAGSCPWTVSSNASWITITSSASGTGIATIFYSVAPSSGAGTQTGTISVAGQTFTITQTVS